MQRDGRFLPPACSAAILGSEHAVDCEYVYTYRSESLAYLWSEPLLAVCGFADACSPSARFMDEWGEQDDDGAGPGQDWNDEGGENQDVGMEFDCEDEFVDIQVGRGLAAVVIERSVGTGVVGEYFFLRKCAHSFFALPFMRSFLFSLQSCFYTTAPSQRLSAAHRRLLLRSQTRQGDSWGWQASSVSSAPPSPVVTLQHDSKVSREAGQSGVSVPRQCGDSSETPGGLSSNPGSAVALSPSAFPREETHQTEGVAQGRRSERGAGGGKRQAGASAERGSREFPRRRERENSESHQCVGDDAAAERRSVVGRSGEEADSGRVSLPSLVPSSCGRTDYERGSDKVGKPNPRNDNAGMGASASAFVGNPTTSEGRTAAAGPVTGPVLSPKAALQGMRSGANAGKGHSSGVVSVTGTGSYSSGCARGGANAAAGEGSLRELLLNSQRTDRYERDFVQIAVRFRGDSLRLRVYISVHVLMYGRA